MSSSSPFPKTLRDFVSTCHWTFAKTYASTWPHEYIVRGKVDEISFVQLVTHIRKHGYLGHFYRKPITYFSHQGMLYWTMGEPIEETTIINRCREEDSYENRKKEPNTSGGPSP